MNFLDKFRYSFDNLNEIENLKNEDKEKKNIYNNPFLKSLLSNSVKVTNEIFPKISEAIDQVFFTFKNKK